MMAQIYDTVSSFSIEQLTGQRRLVRLVSRALPYRPFNLKTTQRLDVTWLPGNPKGVATVLGPTEEPTGINGYWKDRFIDASLDVVSPKGDRGISSPFTLDGLPISSVRECVTIMDAIVREGQPVEVKWDADTRQGFLTEFEKNWFTRHDVEWSMKFTWTDRGEPDVPSVLTQEATLSNVASTIARLRDDLSDVALNPPIPVLLAWYSKVERLVGQISDEVDTLTNTVNTAAVNALSPFNAARLMISSVTNITSAAEDLIEVTEDRVAGAVNYSVLLDAQTATERATASLYTRAIKDSARTIRFASIDERTVLTKTVNTDIASSYIAREGDDLRYVSQLFYDTPFQWRALMLFNGFSSAELDAGQLVLIPKTSEDAGG